MSRSLELLLVSLLLITGFAIRVTDIVAIPGGFSEEEITQLRIIHMIQDGDVVVFFPSHEAGGSASLFGLMETASIALVGDGLLGYRFLPLMISLLTLALTYAVARRLFGPAVAFIALIGMNINIWSVIMARTVAPVNLVPFTMLLVLYALTHAYHIRRGIHPRPVTTYAFSIFAVALTIAIYAHYSGQAILIGCLLYLIYIKQTDQPVLRQIWWNSGYALALVAILCLPFMISILRNPEQSTLYYLRAEHPESIIDFFESIWYTIRAFLPLSFIQNIGDTNPAHNVPGLPPVSPAESVLIIIGLAVCVQRWRQPQFAVLLLFLVPGLLADMWLTEGPDYRALATISPLLFMFISVGIIEVIRILQRQPQISGQGASSGEISWIQKSNILLYLSLILIVLTFIQSASRLNTFFFNDWITRQDTDIAYHRETGLFARYIDRSTGNDPILICTEDLKTVQIDDLETPLPSHQLLDFMLHHEDLNFRIANCRKDFVLIDGGNPMRVIWLDNLDISLLPAAIREWLRPPTPAEVVHIDGVPDRRVWYLDASQTLADRGGELARLAESPQTAMYYPRLNNQQPEMAPHATRFGGNMTLLGYTLQPDRRVYRPGDVLTVVTYWRIEGPIPERTGVFLRMHDNPQISPYTEINMFEVKTDTLQARDVVVQVAYLTLPDNLRPQEYILTLGIYDNNPTNQLPVYSGNGNNRRGDYLQIGPPITIRIPQLRIWG